MDFSQRFFRNFPVTNFDANYNLFKLNGQNIRKNRSMVLKEQLSTDKYKFETFE